MNTLIEIVEKVQSILKDLNVYRDNIRGIKEHLLKIKRTDVALLLLKYLNLNKQMFQVKNLNHNVISTKTIRQMDRICAYYGEETCFNLYKCTDPDEIIPPYPTRNVAGL